MEKLTINDAYVNVPFKSIADVLLETAQANGLKVSQFISNHDYLFCIDGMIQGSYSKADVLSKYKEVNVNEFMQLIFDHNKSIMFQLNDKIRVFVLNNGCSIEYSYNYEPRKEIDNLIIDNLKSFLFKKDPLKFKVGEYCSFPSADIRRAFAKEVRLSDTGYTSIIESVSSETVLFYSAKNQIWIKKDEEAYKACEPNAKRISMDDFAERVWSKHKLRIFDQLVIKVGNVVKIGCQDILLDQLNELFNFIAALKYSSLIKSDPSPDNSRSLLY